MEKQVSELHLVVEWNAKRDQNLNFPAQMYTDDESFSILTWEYKSRKTCQSQYYIYIIYFKYLLSSGMDDALWF
jgi:hypothetical protein